MVMETDLPVQPAARVNGEMLQQMKGKAVCLLGSASEPSSDGTSFKLKTGDNHTVNIKLSEPLTTYVDGLTEVVGVVDDRGHINCHEYIVFGEQLAANFDLTQYNTTVTMLASLPEFYPMVEDQGGM